MCVMRHEITGQAKYKYLIHNRLLLSLQRWIAKSHGWFSGHSNSCNLLEVGMYSCLRKGFIVEEGLCSTVSVI